MVSGGFRIEFPDNQKAKMKWRNNYEFKRNKT